MFYDRKETIERLKQELEILDKGGYDPSVEAPHWMPKIFRDSVSCPNLGLELKVAPCSSCFLMQFVPEELSQREDACHHIPMNAKGETIATLSKAGDPMRLQRVFREWLVNAIRVLEEGADETKLLPAGPAHHSLGPGPRRPCLPPPA